MVKKLREFLFSFFRFGTVQKQRESISWDSLYHTISYRFQNETLLKQAFVHRSFLQKPIERWDSNERLEFLGDAVLGLIVSDELYRHFPEGSEGELTKAKSLVVSRDVLAAQAKKIGLGNYLFLGSGEEKSGGRNRSSILADAYEALLGAIYLDGGMVEVRRFVRIYLLKDMDSLLASKFHHNYKSWLLEYVQGKGWTSPKYQILQEMGPEHRKEFTIEVYVDGKVLGRGKGFRKKQAEQAAAREAVKRFGLLSGEQEEH